MMRQARRSDCGRVLDGKYELVGLVEFVGDRDRTSLWKGVVHGAAGFTRDVAIRKLPSSTAVRQAALHGAALEHANVVRVYDVCRDEDDNLYLVMEWVDGVALGDLIRGARQLGLRVPWPLVGCIGVGALHGMAAGHGRTAVDGAPMPVVHGHLTARSVLLDRRGVVHLTPFGLADGEVAATGERPSIAGDLRDLGVALWEALTGSTPPDGDCTSAPSSLHAVLERAMIQDAAAGFASADEMAAGLAATLGSIPWRRGPQADLGDAVKEVIAALAWSPSEPVRDPASEPGAPVVLVHLPPRALAAARWLALEPRLERRMPFDHSDEPGDDDEPYATYELRRS